MSEQDIQLIRKAVENRWLFWLYFWRIPRYLKAMADEMDRVWDEEAKFLEEKSSIIQARDEAMKANKNVLRWVHVTHRLSTTPEGIRALFAAGKRLSVLLLFLAVAMPMNAQLPPILRQQWTTNADPRAIKVISTNGVQAATNVWELDFTNTATVTVSAVSNANKVMVSFAGATNTGGGGESIWTNFTAIDMEGGTIYGSILTNFWGSPAGIAVNHLTSFWGQVSTIIGLGVTQTNLASIASNNASSILVGDGVIDQSDFARNSDVFLLGDHAAYRISMNDCFVISAFGPDILAGGQFTNSGRFFIFGQGAMSDATVVDSSRIYVYGEGALSGGNARVWNSSQIYAFGPETLVNSPITNSTKIFAIGYQALRQSEFTNSNDIIAIGNSAGTNLVFSAKTNIIIFGNILGANPANNEFWFGNTNNVYRMPGNIGTIRGVTSYSWPTAHATGALTNDGAGALGWYNGYAPATGGAYIATNDGTGWRTTFLGQTNSGHVVFSPDNTYDIGASGANRAKNLYIANLGVFGNDVTSAGSFVAGGGQKFKFTGQGGLYALSDGVFTFRNVAETDFGRLQFGGTTAAFPAFGKTAGEGHLRVQDATGANSTNSLIFGNTVNTTASTGMTMNRQTGRVRLASGSQTYLVTNNLATANSIVTATINTDDANALSVKAIPAAGLITLKVNAATAADTDISFFISAP